ncbi:GNAT family N-acetyltransferase [Salinicola rhizosphaerae]|uniref:N-acetyltransferase GCN5 n=1 Tax=Salinicola rhizosphaerae TaxID=1443141 RepID=A0ABQ3E406_9GAMM|nr:GNAT family N-acetyltransferase [Salinicola rhizosphaerae]GHB21731.1 N-acetyltransferase GCN5 [Salinicola rhizosphaerae]
MWNIARLSCGDTSGIETVASWTFGAWGELHPRTTFAEWRDETRGECGAKGVPSVFVAVSDGQPIATASLTTSDMSIRPAMGPWLASVFVLPAWRGRGIASALVKRVEAEARETGLKRCYLYTPDQTALYARLGWIPTESLIYRGENVTLMHRNL